MKMRQAEPSTNTTALLSLLAFGVGMSWGRVCSTGLLEGNTRKGCLVHLSHLAAPCSCGAGTASQEAHASAPSCSSTCLAPHTSRTHSLTCWKTFSELLDLSQDNFHIDCHRQEEFQIKAFILPIFPTL